MRHEILKIGISSRTHLTTRHASPQNHVQINCSTPEKPTISGVPDKLWSVLQNNLWHATSLRHAHAIIKSKYIKHHTLESFYPDGFSRSIGAVSLFDFRNPSEALRLNPECWTGWLGKERRAPLAVWLRIEANQCMQRSIIEPHSLFRIWQSQGQAYKILPCVEAAHVGSIPIRAITGILLINAFNVCQFYLLDDIALCN